MAEAKHEQMLELIDRNTATVGPGGQGQARGVPDADMKQYDCTRPAGELNIRSQEAKRELLSPQDQLPYELVPLDDKLGVNKFVAAEDDPHLLVDNRICRECPGQWCLFVCPSQRYSKDAEGVIHVDSEGCLECGTCRLACLPGGLYWKYPLGGFGVCFRLG
jgi:ferredoxin like protein